MSASLNLQDPNRAQLDLAWDHYKNHRLQDAVAVCESILALSADPEAAYIAGLVATVTGQHEVAVDLLSALVSLHPKVVAFHVALGNAYLASSRPADALPQYREALRLDPACEAAREALRDHSTEA